MTISNEDILIKGKIDGFRAIQKLWINRKNTTEVNEICILLVNNINNKSLFTSLEFYMPQIAHMALHLSDTRCESLELLILVMCELSMHCALQFHFLFSSALEDFQPENCEGEENPFSNSHLHFSCSRIISNIEKAVTFGGDFDSILSSDNDGTNTDSSSTQLLTKEHYFRRKILIASSILRIPSNQFEGYFNGHLLFKRNQRKSLQRKTWKSRYFVIENRMLLCFRDPHSVSPLRALALENCRIEMINYHESYGDTLFDITCLVTGTRYHLRAQNKEQRTQWINILYQEISGSPCSSKVLGSALIHAEKDIEKKLENKIKANEQLQIKNYFSTTDLLNVPPGNSVGSFNIKDLSRNERIRYCFFSQQKVFVINLTNICETLRFKERSERREILQKCMRELTIPPLAYIPLCSSSQPFAAIRNTVPFKCHAFSTKARCPALMIFELEKHPKNIDVANFLANHLTQYDEDEIIGYNSGTNSNSDLLAENNLNSLIQDFNNITVGGEGVKPESTAEVKPVQSLFYDLDIPTNKDIWANEVSTPPSSPVSTSTSSIKITNIDKAMVDEKNKDVMYNSFYKTTEEIKSQSVFAKNLPSNIYKIDGFIAKSNDDVRQEVFIMQLLTYVKKAFALSSGISDSKFGEIGQEKLYVHTYRIMNTSKSTGLIELIPNSLSIDGIKSSPDYPGSLGKWYEMKFEKETNPSRYEEAIENYMASLASYSILSYVFAFKDRHNGNIMIDKDGHIIHIDFGFVFGLAPGKQFSMEVAPFKLTAEMVDVMGGINSGNFARFKNKLVLAFKIIRAHIAQLSCLIDIMRFKSNFPSFQYNQNAYADFVSRLCVNMKDSDIEKHVQGLVNSSYKNIGTGLYDDFQVATNGIKK